MLQIKRDQLKNSMRKKSLDTLFHFKRKQIIQGSYSIFQEISQEMLAESQPNHEKICKSLIYCLKTHPQQENTYIVLGNYLIWNKHQYTIFFTLLTDTPFYVQNQMWCFKMVACIIDELLITQQWNQKEKIQQMEIIMSSACMIVSQLQQQLKRYQTNDKTKQGKIWSYFMEILRIQLNNSIYHQFPSESIYNFHKILSILPINQNNADIQQIMQMWFCLKDILLKIDQVVTRQQLFASSRVLFWFILKNQIEERDQCIDILLSLLEKYSIDFMNIFFEEAILKEIIFLFVQNQNKKEKLSFFLRELIPMCSLNQLIFLINTNTHRLLTKTMQWSMQHYNNECLLNCMAGLYSMLLRFQDYSEEKVLKRILDQIEELNFYEMLQGMILQSQNKDIEKYLNLLVDQFYSDDQFHPEESLV